MGIEYAHATEIVHCADIVNLIAIRCAPDSVRISINTFIPVVRFFPSRDVRWLVFEERVGKFQVMKFCEVEQMNTI